MDEDPVLRHGGTPAAPAPVLELGYELNARRRRLVVTRLQFQRARSLRQEVAQPPARGGVIS
jgi:hypothetical protein